MHFGALTNSISLKISQEIWRRTPRLTGSQEKKAALDNLNGNKCQCWITSMEEDLKEALQEDDISLFS